MKRSACPNYTMARDESPHPYEGAHYCKSIGFLLKCTVLDIRMIVLNRQGVERVKWQRLRLSGLNGVAVGVDI